MNTLFALLASSLLFGAEYVVNVPEGEVISNTTSIAAETAGDVFVKTGKGTWYHKATLGGTTKNFSKMEIREGTVEQAAGTSLVKIPRIEIKSGATLKQLNNVSYKNNGVTVSIEKGGTFNDAAGAFSGSGLQVEGSGRFENFAGTLTAGLLTDFTGDMSFGQGVGGSVNFGDGVSAENDPDLSRFGKIDLAGGADGSGNFPRLVFQNVGPMVVTNRFGGLGKLTVNAGSVVTFSNLWMTAGTSAGCFFQGTVTNVNGQLSIRSDSNNFTMSDVNARYVQIGGVTYGTYPIVCPTRLNSMLWYPSQTQMKGTAGSGYGARILEQGAVFYTQYQQPFYTEVRSGSKLVFGYGAMQTSNTKSGERMKLVFDEGTMSMDLDSHDGGFGFVITTPTNVRFEIAEGGMTLESIGMSSAANEQKFTEGCEFTDNGSNGPLKIRGRASFTFYQPLDIGGNVTIEDGTFNVPSKAAFYAADAKPPLGTGSLTLGNGRIRSYLPQGNLTRLADTAGGTLHLTGSSSLHMNSNNTGINWQIGPTSAASCSIVRDKGAALFFDNDTSKQTDFFKNGKGTCVIGGGLPMGANGKLPTIPIFVQDPSYFHSDDSWGGEVDFLTYGSSGLVRFDDYATQLTDDATAVVFLDSDVTMTQDAAAAAINVGKSKSLMIPAGMKLKLGSDTGTACVLLNGNTGKITGTSKNGTGTLDFGACEGVVACCRRGGKITANIAGTGGLSVVGSYLSDVNGWGLTLGGNNTYSGGTRINNCRVFAASDAAFGVGDVWALGGQGAGGQIRFNNGENKVTIANNLHLSGFGVSQGNGVSDHLGAIWAESDAEITGLVDLVGPTRVKVGGEAELRFSNVISGASVSYFKPTTDVDIVGKVVYDAVNTYTGETEVIRTTLELKRGATAGTGDITLDGGVLIINSNRDGVTMPNVIRGVGTVKLAGPNGAVVNFKAAPTNDIFLQQEHTLDLNNRSYQVNSLAGFTEVANSGEDSVHLYVTDSTPFTGTVGANVTVHVGQEYPAPGLIMIVR